MLRLLSGGGRLPWPLAPPRMLPGTSLRASTFVCCMTRSPHVGGVMSPGSGSMALRRLQCR
eukprot:12935944-Prorocentrum_lima.AAC.1